ncbi:MAG: hypothetical protein IJR69_03160 [Bacteroidaceae bacterium]|nr:hypothetical protein [Bacteroidaceae bacterium]
MNIKKHWIMLAIALTVLCTVSCGDDNDEGGTTNNPVVASDPEGTITVNLTNGYNDDRDRIGNEIQIYGGDVWMYNFAMSSSNNFVLVRGNGNPSIITVGKKKGLSDIREVPATGAGWSDEVAVIPGYGYVCKATGGWTSEKGPCIVRIYVVDYIESITGGIIGAIIKYQQWNPEE